MNSVSNMLYLILIASLALTACEDKKEQPTKSRLDLKGFQIIRGHQTNQQQSFSADDFESSTHLEMKDSIGAGVYPDGVTLITNVKCKELQNEGNSKYIYHRTKETPFSKPVPLFSILPEEALFRTHDKSSDSLDCVLSFQAIDKDENRYVLTNPISGTIFDSDYGAYLQLKSNGTILPPAIDTLPVIDRGNMTVFSLQTDNRIGFDAHKMVCETFVLDEKYYLADFLDLKRLDFSKAQYYTEDPMELLAHQAMPSQICRFFVYAGEELVGYSSYFRLEQDIVPPSIDFDIEPREQFLGSPNGNHSMTFKDSVMIGYMRVRNLSSVPMFIAIDNKESIAKVQFNGNTHLITEPERNGLVYDTLVGLDAYSKPGSFKSSALGESKTIYEIPGDTVLIFHFVLRNLEKCRMSDVGHVDPMSTSGQQVQIAGGGTTGMFYSLSTPTIQLLGSKDPHTLVVTPDNYQVLWTAPKAEAGSAFIPATSETERIHRGRAVLTDFEGVAEVDNCRTGGEVLDLR